MAPAIGWNLSSTKGASVSIWGKNIGTPNSRGNDYVTLTIGATVVNFTNGSDYSEWAVYDSIRQINRTSFWLNSSCPNGTGTITVVVGGMTSGSLPFTVISGNIYFIDGVNGNDSNDGKADVTGGGHGPKARLQTGMRALAPGDVLYARAYASYQADDYKGIVGTPLGHDGTLTAWKAVTNYPAEVATMIDVGSHLTLAANYWTFAGFVLSGVFPTIWNYNINIGYSGSWSTFIFPSQWVPNTAFAIGSAWQNYCIPLNKGGVPNGVGGSTLYNYAWNNWNYKCIQA